MGSAGLTLGLSLLEYKSCSQIVLRIVVMSRINAFLTWLRFPIFALPLPIHIIQKLWVLISIYFSLLTKEMNPKGMSNYSNTVSDQ